MGFRSAQRANNYVATIPRQDGAPAPINAEVIHTIDAQPNATQHVELRTSAIDRAVGFMIATAPLCFGFAVAVVGIVVLGFGVPLVSVATLVIVFTVFAVVWTVAYLYTLSISAEGVSLFEAQEKWAIIRTEQQLRWQAWFLDREERRGS